MKTCNCGEVFYSRSRSICDTCEDLRVIETNRIYAENNERLSKIIPYHEGSNYIVDYGLGSLERVFNKYADDYGSFEYNPDFQRGHVWSLDQQIAYIESLAMNILSAQQKTITLNCPEFSRNFKDKDSDLDGFVIIDGLQRAAACIDFYNGKFKIFGSLYYDDLLMSKYSLKRVTMKIQVYSYQYKSEVLEHYLLFNRGGVVHSDSEIRRVEVMLEGLK